MHANDTSGPVRAQWFGARKYSGSREGGACLKVKPPSIGVMVFLAILDSTPFGLPLRQWVPKQSVDNERYPDRPRC